MKPIEKPEALEKREARPSRQGEWGLAEIEKAAQYMAKSGLFGVKDPVQAVALMLLAQAEGTHPARAVQEYHIIGGRPALRADAMLARFLAAGGRVEWHALTDERAEATFSHPQGGTVRLAWTLEDAKRAGLLDKRDSGWHKYPRAMLRARLISEGVRTVFPGVATGVYTPEEVMDLPEPAQVVSPASPPSPSRPAPLPSPAPITPEQVGALAQAFTALGLKGEPARELAQRRVERELASIKDLTREEAEDLLAYLEELAKGLEPFPRVRRGELIGAWLEENPKGAPGVQDLLSLFGRLQEEPEEEAV